MLYLFCGSDVGKARAKAFEWVAKARAKEPNLVYARLAREEITDAALEESAASGGLFVKRLLILLDDPFQSVKNTEVELDVGHDMSDTDAGFTKPNIIEDHLDELVKSDNVIIILAPKLSAAKVKKIAAKAVKTYEFNIPTRREAARGFNGDLVNALAAKSREKLWLEIERALRAGDAPEMLHGLLHWKARDLMQRNSRAWPPAEARALSLALIALLQDSRAKGLNLADSLERFALSI